MRTIDVLVGSSVLGLGLLAACGNTGVVSSFIDLTTEAGTTASGGDPPSFGGGPLDGSADSKGEPFVLLPENPVVTFTSGQGAETIAFKAMTAAGTSVPASFTIDRGEIGGVGLTSGIFTASGAVGGTAKVTATRNGRSATTSVVVKVKTADNGSPSGDAGAEAGGGGAGGYGGVGGEGPGGAVSAQTISILKGATVSDPGLAGLYPYDKTVWPRGILAPLLQWAPGAQGDYDAVYIHLREASFEYEGFFSKTSTPFTHHPIPQEAWRKLLASNAGEDVTVTLVFAKGGVAYGPITRTWKVASAPLKGIVYYNSYGTRLAKNYGGAMGGDGRFGAATLAIRGSSTDPALIAGGNGGSSQCRVCHSVAANGSVLITQRSGGDERKFSAYDLKTGAETTLTPEGGAANFSWPAIYPDGTMFVGDSSTASGSTTTPNGLFAIPSGASGSPSPIPTNWPSGFSGAYPSFSPDGKSLAFTMFKGAPGADAKTLGMMTFDNATKTFGALTTLHTPAAGSTALFPSFLPTNDGLVFERETRFNGRDYGGTRSDADVAPPNPKADVGTHAELWWLDLKTKPPTAVALSRLNGKEGSASYLPIGPNGHDDDTTLNYEPTVNPVPSGGYAWVVFTSRRRYGNIATINPFYSDPRFHDLTATATPKKLWVAAIDLNAPAGTDPSHPAFYLPAQELLAGNSRGYWVVDPCRSDGNACDTGDECCGGFCRPGNAGKLVCTATVPACAQEFEACTTTADCCNTKSNECINRRCAAPGPR